MIGAIPQVLIDMGAVAGVFIAIITLAALTWRTPPVQWFWRQVREDREERMLAAVTKGTEDIRKACTTDEAKAVWASQGAEFPNLAGPQFAAFINAEIKKWAKVVKASGARLD